MDSELFITQFELNHPFPTATGVQVTPNIQSFGQSCPIMTSCPTSLAALTAGTDAATGSDGLIDLGPLGKRPLWLAIVLAIITALVVLTTLYAMWRRAYPNNPVPNSSGHLEKRTDPFVPLRETTSVDPVKAYSPVTTLSSVGGVGETRIHIYDDVPSMGAADMGASDMGASGMGATGMLRHSKSAKSLKVSSSMRPAEAASMVTRSHSLHNSKFGAGTTVQAVPPLPRFNTTDSSDEKSEATFRSTRKSIKEKKSHRGPEDGVRDGLRRIKSSHSLASSQHSRQQPPSQMVPLIDLKKQKSLVELEEKSMIPSSAKVILKKQKSMRARTRPSSPTEDEEAEHAFTRLVATKSLKYDAKKRRSKSIDVSFRELSTSQRTSPDASFADVSLVDVIRSQKKENNSFESTSSSAAAAIRRAAAPEMELGEYTPPPSDDDDADEEEEVQARRKSPPIKRSKSSLKRSKSHSRPI